MRYRYESDPHPHIYIEEIVDRDVYRRMHFPDELASGEDWDISPVDAKFEQLLEDPLWAELHDQLYSDRFVREVIGRFAEDMRESNCLVDPDGFRLIDFVESREDKAKESLGVGGDPNELFVAMHLQSKGFGGYREFVHLDWARRLVGSILFFSDADEEGLEGGELAFYRDRAFRDDRWSHDPELTTTFTPRHNTGVIFLNSNSGFHGPRAIRKLDGRRRWIYYTISSKVDVWPAMDRVP